MGVGQSPNWSALPKRPWATTAEDSSAGGVGGTAQCSLGHRVLGQLCLNQLCLVLAAQPPPQLPEPTLTPHFGFPSRWVPLLPLSELCPLWVWQLSLFQLLKSPAQTKPISANTSCSQKSSGEGDSALPAQSAFGVQSWLRYLKNLMVFEHWLYYLFIFTF